MGGPLRISAKGLGLVKGFEGFRPRASRLPDGRWIIGYGHTRTARPGLTVSPADAELVLRYSDLPPIEALIRDEVLAPLTQNEFDALVSFAWNIGPGAFQASSVLAHINAGDRLAAAADMWLWRKGRAGGEVKVIDALVRRRAAEIALFLAHPSGPSPAPGALIRPLPDEGAIPAMPPAERTVIIEARNDDGLAGRSRSPEANAPQAAARAVADRIARILGESAAPAAQPANLAGPGEEGPSVEEITRAIADLAGPEAELQPAHRGPPDGIERRRMPRPAGEPVPRPQPAPAQPVTPGLPPAQDVPLPPAEGVIVDDLAPPVIDDQKVRQSMAGNGRVYRRANGAVEGLGNWLPFALLSGLGLVGLFMGFQRLIARAAQAPMRESDSWVGPLLAFGGGLLFLIATYYLYRAMTRDD
ncbi:MAG: lysozyme [Hyphomonas sp.]